MEMHRKEEREIKLREQPNKHLQIQLKLFAAKLKLPIAFIYILQLLAQKQNSLKPSISQRSFTLNFRNCEKVGVANV